MQTEQRSLTGHHLVVDAYVADGAVLNNPSLLCDLFDRLVDALGMEYLQRPAAYRVPIDPDKLDGEEDEGGWSVICQITTSHIALHGWPLRSAFMMDVFSCMPFDQDKACEVIRKALDVVWMNRQEILRGIL